MFSGVHILYDILCNMAWTLKTWHQRPSGTFFPRFAFSFVFKSDPLLLSSSLLLRFSESFSLVSLAADVVLSHTLSYLIVSCVTCIFCTVFVHRFACFLPHKSHVATTHSSSVYPQFCTIQEKVERCRHKNSLSFLIHELSSLLMPIH